MRNISVCLSTDLFSYYDENNEMLVVVVDILRATSVISTAFEYGVKSIIPVISLEEAKKYLNLEGFIVAAERNAEPIEGIPYGNSPFQYMNDIIKGKTLVLTTTNGTKSINISKSHEVITASFINYKSIEKYVKSSDKDVVILCAGWRGLPNLEDSIFAGYLCSDLLKSNKFTTNCDSLRGSIAISKDVKGSLYEYLKNSAHRKRLKHLNMEEDTKFCLTPSIMSTIVPVYCNGKLEPKRR